MQNELAEAHARLALKNNELEILHITDQLTQLYNRMKIENLLENEITHVKKEDGYFSLLLLDIDHFKRINDNYGHSVGDQVLKEFSAILTETAGELYHVGRWGGVEFMI